MNQERSNPTLSLDSAIPSRFHIGRHRSAAGERGLGRVGEPHRS